MPRTAAPPEECRQLALISEASGRVDIGEIRSLPDYSGVYVVVDAGRFIYVGMAKNIRKRWKNHHRLKQIRDLYSSAEIYFFAVPIHALREEEAGAIKIFRPLLNGARTAAARELTVDDLDFMEAIFRW